MTKTDISMQAKSGYHEAKAASTTQGISYMMENYYATNGSYPASEAKLAKLLASDLSIPGFGNNVVIAGYRYKVVNLKPHQYTIQATPEKCGITGNKVFVIETHLERSWHKCQ